MLIADQRLNSFRNRRCEFGNWPSSSRGPGDPTYLVADPSAARATLNFRPAYSDLATIIRTAWAWHKKAHPLKTG
jgi:UDP-glucose 4-epimerase